ncbi:MAG: NAD(P)-binding protein, partial [Pirellula sp.]|nr:NAD(P)-binding protein [Pirellula sp.]
MPTGSLHPRIDAALASLPTHLVERTRAIAKPSTRDLRNEDTIPSGPVVYWTHHAQRVDENPALDVARIIAARLQRPLLVYQGLSQSYRYASDRHHIFQLQSAKVLSRSYRNLGMRYALHVETEEDSERSLLRLANLACLLVTDDFPGEPTLRWMERLAHLPNLNLLAVDTACVVPMQLVGRAFDRAFAYRDATKKLYQERVDLLWPCVDENPEPYARDLPFQAIDIENCDLWELVARCRIDHGVPAVADTVGGSDAGYQRWQAFLEGPCRHYAAKRNDPLAGVASRMSAYLHYGMVSPMRLAREANARKAEKYLDELLIWRELAYSFCFYRPDHASLSALPHWATQTLMEHESDPRSAIYSWESLARAKTDDRLWNACQESLIRHGELHNNVRMTWGKAMLHWTSNAASALEWLIDLNHRFALDGRDPASYGGILWCLGQFDRPFTPEQSVLGTVRDRPTEEHARRIKLDAYENHVRRPICSKSIRVAIVGAGLAGSMCARTLVDQGIGVTLFEKSRGPSGRCATRRGDDHILFDHGAPYIEFTDRRWDLYVRSWEQDGILAPWHGNFVQWQGNALLPQPSTRMRWVGVSGMNRLGKHLAEDLHVVPQTLVSRVRERNSAHELIATRTDHASIEEELSLGAFDVVVFAVPAEQARPLVPSTCSWYRDLPTESHSPCWTLMVSFQNRWDVPFDGARSHDGPFAWL